VLALLLSFCLQQENPRIKQLEEKLAKVQAEIAQTDKELKELTFFTGTLDGWIGDKELWSVENGNEIVGKSPGIKKNTFLYRDMVLADFRLVVEVKLVPNNGNSGIQYRSKPLKSGEMKGYQADVGETWWGKLYEESRRGLLTKEPHDDLVKVGDWNTYEILAVGTHVWQALNGTVTVDLEDPKGFPDGVIALQLHSGEPEEVRFRILKLEVNPKPELTTVKPK
jgi:hypothetical protein